MNTLSSLFVLATIVGIGAWFAHDRIRAYVDRAPINLDHLDSVNLGQCDWRACAHPAVAQRIGADTTGLWDRKLCAGHDNEGIARNLWVA